MKRFFKSRWVWTLAVFALTAASYAQWSNPADDVPAYHPSAPLSLKSIPPLLHGAQPSSSGRLGKRELLGDLAGAEALTRELGDLRQQGLLPLPETG